MTELNAFDKKRQPPGRDSTETRKTHFETLDLLRGTAAFCVVLFHFSSRLEFGGLFFHGYLAVDFFFCLSGYVIFEAYYAKLASGSLKSQDFIVARLIRFVPLVIFGNLIAAVADIFRPGVFSFSEHMKDVFFVLVISAFLLPTFYKTSLEDTTYPLNGPIWSLFFELIANIIFALIAKSRYFLVLVKCTIFISLMLLIYASQMTGDIHFGPHIEFFQYAFPRVLFSFFVGVLLHNVTYRGRILRWWHCATIIIFIFIAPKIANTAVSALYDLISITIIFPVVVYSGANHLDAKFKKLAKINGELSFPLYCIHYPLVRVSSQIFRSYGMMAGANILFSIFVACVISIFSLVLYRLYDIPIRTYLNRLRRPV